MSTKSDLDTVVPLDAFVAATINQIIRGVAQAQADVQGSGAHVNPTGTNFNQSSLADRTFTSEGNLTQTIEFEVAITASENTSASGKAVIIGVLGFGIGAQLETKLSTVSRIKFCVPILLPPSRVPGHQPKT